jgi:hypothetical protein
MRKKPQTLLVVTKRLQFLWFAGIYVNFDILFFLTRKRGFKRTALAKIRNPFMIIYSFRYAFIQNKSLILSLLTPSRTC